MLLAAYPDLHELHVANGDGAFYRCGGLTEKGTCH